MSKPNLPPLPQMDVGVSGQVKFAYSQEAMTAYAEEAVRQALAGQPSTAVTNELPGWEETSAKVYRGETLTPLELFIHENEPAGADADAWRDQLLDAMASIDKDPPCSPTSSTGQSQ